MALSPMLRRPRWSKEAKREQRRQREEERRRLEEEGLECLICDSRAFPAPLKLSIACHWCCLDTSHNAWLCEGCRAICCERCLATRPEENTFDMHAKGDAFFSPLPSVGGMSSLSPLQEGAGEDEGDSSGLCGEAALDYLLEDLLEDLEDRMPTIDTGQAQAIGGS